MGHGLLGQNKVEEAFKVFTKNQGKKEWIDRAKDRIRKLDENDIAIPDWYKGYLLANDRDIMFNEIEFIY